MELDLSKFKGEEKAEPERTIVFRGKILAVDNAIASSGWAVVECSPEGLRVTNTGMFTTAIVATGHEDTLLRADRLHGDWYSFLAFPIDLIVHAYPPVGGRRGVKYQVKPEIAIASAMALRCAAYSYGIRVEMVADQRAKTRLTGNPSAKKPEVGAAVRAMFPHLAVMPYNNDHVRDALSLAVVASETYGRIDG